MKAFSKRGGKVEKHKLCDLIHRVANGDKTACAEIWTEMKDGVYSFALIYLGDKQLAEDALQETFLALFKAAINFKNNENPRAWILTITRNIAISIVRKRSHETEFNDCLSEIADSINIENKIENSQFIKFLLSQLPMLEQQIIILHIIVGLKHFEIAKMLELPLGTVYRKYSQSLKVLNKAAKAEDYRGDYHYE